MIRKSLNIWSVPGALEGTLEPIHFLRAAKAYGYESAELAVGDVGSKFGVDATQMQCEDLRAQADTLGLKLDSLASGLYWMRAVGDDNAVSQAEARTDVERMIQIASWIGAKTLLTIPGAVDVFFLPSRPIQDIEGVYDRALQAMRDLAPTAEAHGVRLGIENVWNRFLLSPLEMREFIDQVGSKFVGAYVDVANLLPFGYAGQWLRVLGERVVGVHFKDYRRAVGTHEGFVDLLEGDVDWADVMAALTENRYEGPVVAELIPTYKQHPMVRVANASTAMDAILGRRQFGLEGPTGPGTVVG